MLKTNDEGGAVTATRHRAARLPWLLRTIHAGSTVIAASGVLAQATPTPAPTPVPEAAAAPTVRIVAPSAGSDPNPSQAVPLNPVEVVPPRAGVKGKEAPKDELVVAPIPISNPAVGYGLAVAAVYTIARTKLEDTTPPTTLGAGGFYTSNGSWAGAVAAKAFLKQDRYRVTLAGGGGKINYDLFALGPNEAGVPIRQQFVGVLGEFLVGLGRDWFAGLRAAYGKTTAGLQGGASGSIPVPPDQLDVTLVGLGLKGERDSRDSIFYPTAGSQLQFLVNHNDTAFGSDFTYTKTDISYSDYATLADRLVVAVQAAGCYASEGAPFYDLCLFGAKNVLRGYTVGQYLDRWTVAVQGEARWRFANRWIGTAFLGVGDVQPALPTVVESEVLPAGGVGVQWIAAPQNMITVRVDYGWGKDGSNAVYVSIGQAF